MKNEELHCDGGPCGIRHITNIMLSSVRTWRSMYSSAFKAQLQSQMNVMRKEGTYKLERVLTSPQSCHITVEGSTTPVLNFCANNYLGLSNDPRLVTAAKKALDERGFGLSSVRFICGTQDIHKELEAKLTEFHGTEDTILYPSCFDANAGLFEAILTEDDAIISDALNHASIIDGVRLCKAKRYRYAHLDVSDLESSLVEAAAQRFRLIATDGAFSMDGDVAPLANICALADKHDALVFVDDCHATGFFGRTGRGSPEQQKVEGRIDILNSTLGKALGGATGGYSTGKKEIIDILRQKSRPYLFSNALAPSVVGAGLAVMELLMNSSGLVEKLAENTTRFRTRMIDAGFSVLGSPEHAIAPVLLGDAALASTMADDLLKLGIYVIGFSYPVVPKGAARIRVQLSAAHTLTEVDQAVDAFITVGKVHNIIK